MHPAVLSLAIHNHQPVGNFDHVFAEATDKAYAPLLGALERHPRIRLALHYSGPLRAVLAEEWGLGVFGAPGGVWAEAADRRLGLHEAGEPPAADRITVTEVHSGLMLAFTPSAAAVAWSFPLTTVSNSEGGYERTDQGAVLLLRWPVHLEPGQVWEQLTRCQITGAGYTPSERMATGGLP